MTSRISRSASIPIPNSSSAARNIENVISIPFATPAPRPRLVSNTRLQVGSTPAVRTSAPSPPAARSLSGSYSSALGRSPTMPVATYEPRIIRATTGSAHSADAACVPTPTPPSPTMSRVRRHSVARVPNIVPVPALRTTPHPIAFPVTGTAPPPAPPFQRPAYLDRSALRDLLFTDAPALLSPSQPSESSPHLSSAPSYGPSSRVSTPVPPHASYPYMRREHTPNLDTDDESNASPPPPSMRGTPAPVTGVLLINPTLRLPTRWSEQDRHQALTVSVDGRDLTFYGPSCIGERDSAAARANYPIPPACGIYYYEVEILHKGSKGHISIGFSSGEVRLSRLPGWEKHSWGYHADDGWIFPGMKEGISYGPTYDTGDVVGCGIDFTQNRAFYTKNGSFLGMAFENVGKDLDVYPSIGLRHTNESIRVNFGHAPFKFAIEDHADSQRNTVWSNIQTTKLDWNVLQGKPREGGDTQAQSSAFVIPKGGALEEERIQTPIRKLVLSYLAHHGYARTARAFQVQCERLRAAASGTGGQDMDTDEPRASSSRSAELDGEYDLRARIDIVNAVLKGDIDAAIMQTEAHHPTVLEREQGLMLFKLRCRKFVELILDASEALKKVQAEEQERTRENENENEREREMKLAQVREDAMEQDGMDEPGAMDVDEPSLDARSTTSDIASVAFSAAAAAGAKQMAARSPVPPSPSAVIAREALHTAINYGQQLEASYKNDVRSEVRNHLKRTFGVVAFADPLAAGGEVAEMAGQEARAKLANELNQAILESQGKPAHPALETLYRQTAACVVQLGLLGAGSAAFADMQKEFLEA